MTDNHDPLGPLGQAFLATQSQSHREALSDLSTQEINNLSMAEYARLTGRENPATAAYRSLYDEPAQPVPTAAVPPVPVAPQVPYEAPQGIDINSMDMQQYGQLRAQLGIGRGTKEGRGIFDSVGSQSQEYRDAAARQTGRTGYKQGTNAGAEMMERRGRTIVRQDQIPPSGRRQFYAGS